MNEDMNDRMKKYSNESMNEGRNKRTRKHSNSMCTARLLTVHASVAIRSQLEEGGIQANTFEQV